VALNIEERENSEEKASVWEGPGNELLRTRAKRENHLQKVPRTAGKKRDGEKTGRGERVRRRLTGKKPDFPDRRKL